MTKPLTETDHEHERQLRRIRRLLYHLLHPSYDIEDLSIRIWTECWLRGSPAGFRLLRWRATDLVRTSILRQGAEAAAATTASDSPSTDSSNLDLASVLDKTSLTGEEGRLIFQRFYLGRTCGEIGRDQGRSRALVQRDLKALIEKLRASGRRLL